MVAGTAVLPEPRLHEQLRLQGAAAPVGRGRRVSLLSRSNEHGRICTASITPASHGVRLEESRGDASFLRGPDRLAAAGDVVRIRRALRQGADVLPLLLRAGRR